MLDDDVQEPKKEIDSLKELVNDSLDGKIILKESKTDKKGPEKVVKEKQKQTEKREEKTKTKEDNPGGDDAEGSKLPSGRKSSSGEKAKTNSKKTKKETDSTGDKTSVETKDKKTTKRKKKSKPVKYDRNNPNHKSDVISIFDEYSDNWRIEHKASAKEASVKMEGEDMYDGEGNILDTFKECLLSPLKGWEVSQEK